MWVRDFYVPRMGVLIWSISPIISIVSTKVMVWNVQDVGKPSFYSTFNRLGQLYNPDLCVLLETRLCGLSLDHFRCQLQSNWACYAINSQGLTGSIIMLWHRGMAKVDIFNRNSQQVSIAISKNCGPTWLFSRVYASTSYRERKVVWQEVSALLNQAHLWPSRGTSIVCFVLRTREVEGLL